MTTDYFDRDEENERRLRERRQFWESPNPDRDPQQLVSEQTRRFNEAAGHKT